MIGHCTFHLVLWILSILGMVGITLNRGAMKRWILAQSDRFAITGECMKLAGTDPIKRYLKQKYFQY